MSRLPTVLDAGARGVLVIRPPGYLLVLDNALGRAKVYGFSAASLRGRHDEGTLAHSYSLRTVKTYAVKWREPDGQTFVGSLALGPRALRLEGRRRGAEEAAVDRRLGYDELRGLSIGRLDGRSALAVQLLDGAYLVADAGLGAPIVQELVERLAALVPSENLRLSRNRSVLRPG